ncbi:SgcJ/EcaC family oxidoreductase [Edwardsiella ictaluri]|uniref:Calcium/calmodulin dependent protein kinase II n=2 Tax=Edwardsiella ictaluri TaxID=67780 RepID=C5B7W8_EDWI9|nr:Calcium/calmodulin dependent protein kinase II [Edwardsiella ictaluri 93-146]ARD38143.1 DUF4440 domain-containing protein [Edwardsiella ictaluri]AVZ81033.1 SgcJ/EcaC family oxidoreductase [Edwardsiella ictaluri]EKS7764635.1 SgcJ/EcaC family oxidoreductase [Edwardsiella ictaluri]EKS7771633.1 SgcJ/EcaC family oxidoreductase [Edwardsiella ictaluri]
MKKYVMACALTLIYNVSFAAPLQCVKTDPAQIAALFDQWNNSLQSGDPQKVTDNYLTDAVLLPTVSSKTKLTQDDRITYFKRFLEKKPHGKIDNRTIKIGCNHAIDTGTYTFTFADNSKISARYTFTYAWDGNAWKISTHHSSVMP